MIPEEKFSAKQNNDIGVVDRIVVKINRVGDGEFGHMCARIFRKFNFGMLNNLAKRAERLVFSRC